MSEKDPEPLFSEEDFDGEFWDEYAPEIVKLAGVTSYAMWLEIMMPIWLEQMRDYDIGTIAH